MQSRFTKKQQQWSERKTKSVFDDKRRKYKLLCLYIAAYPTSKEKTVVITQLHEPNYSSILTSEGTKVRRVYLVAHDMEIKIKTLQVIHFLR